MGSGLRLTLIYKKNKEVQPIFVSGGGSKEKMGTELPNFNFLKCLECSETQNKHIKYFSIFRVGLVLRKILILMS